MKTKVIFLFEIVLKLDEASAAKMMFHRHFVWLFLLIPSIIKKRKFPILMKRIFPNKQHNLITKKKKNFITCDVWNFACSILCTYWKHKRLLFMHLKKKIIGKLEKYLPRLCKFSFLFKKKKNVDDNIKSAFYDCEITTISRASNLKFFNFNSKFSLNCLTKKQRWHHPHLINNKLDKILLVVAT